MRAFWGVVLLGLSASACAEPPPPETPVQVAPPAPLVAPQGAQGPVVMVTGEQITVDGTPAGSSTELERAGELQQVDAVFEAMKARRAAWKAEHPTGAFPGVATLVVAPGTSGRAFASVFQTIAYAGYARIRVAVGDGYVDTRAQVPGPPCGTPEAPCPPGPSGSAGPHHVMHVQADVDGWRLRVPREGGAIDVRGDGTHGSVEKLRAEAADVLRAARVGAFVAHVAPDAPFSRLAPFLAELGVMGAALPGGVTVSVLRIDQVPATASASASSDPSSVTGRLAPELIQKNVRARFGELRACYERLLARDPAARGKASTRFRIGQEGAVQVAQTTLSGALTPEVGTCIEGVFRKLTFPPPSGGVVDVTYPIDFSPGE